MRMQEVIMQLRELAPVAAARAKAASEGARELTAILSDAERADSVESLRALVELAGKKATQLYCALDTCEDKTRALQQVNEAYKEKLGPRAKKPKDAPGQMELPGIALGPETVGRDA